MATIMDGGGSLDLDEPKVEEEEECVVQTVMPTTSDGAASLVGDPFGDEEGDNDIPAAPPSRHLSTSSDGSSVEIGVGEEVG